MNLKTFHPPASLKSSPNCARPAEHQRSPPLSKHFGMKPAVLPAEHIKPFSAPNAQRQSTTPKQPKRMSQNEIQALLNLKLGRDLLPVVWHEIAGCRYDLWFSANPNENTIGIRSVSRFYVRWKDSVCSKTRLNGQRFCWRMFCILSK